MLYREGVVEMKNDQRPEPLDELDERLRDARQSQNRRAGLDKPEERLSTGWP